MRVKMQHASSDASPVSFQNGAVELREDVPLKGGAGEGCGAGGPRIALGSFALLTGAVTVALLAQLRAGDSGPPPHGAASSAAAACSNAGAGALQAGGCAADAAVAAAVCLALLVPHRCSLDASGSLLYWEYRKSRMQAPTLIEWTIENDLKSAADGNASTARPPRLLRALAALHARHGCLPWSTLLQPTIDLARNGFEVSEGLSISAAAQGMILARGTMQKMPVFADYLETLQKNTSKELNAAWLGDAGARTATAAATRVGAWRVFSGGPGTLAALRALNASLHDEPADPGALSLSRVVEELKRTASAGTWPPRGAASGLAVVDRFDTYIALVAGLSIPFGSGAPTAAGWTPDEPTEPIDVAPALLLDGAVCGTRYVVGAESAAALAQVAAALGGDGGPGGAPEVEAARAVLQRGGAAFREVRRPPAPAPGPALAALPPAPPPYAAVNVVQQRADALQSHADSRGGGLSSRF